MTATRPLRYGLVASRRHRLSDVNGLVSWARRCDATIRALGMEIRAVGGAYDTLIDHTDLADYESLKRLPSSVDGGVMRLASGIAGGIAPSGEIDGVIYLMDPADPSSLYPEAQALKRQCVIHGKPFIATVAGALNWLEVESVLAGIDGPSGGLVPATETVALIAHDALKDRMVEFAAANFDLLSRFSSRVGTGTTGARLNEMARAHGWSRDEPWVRPYRSGPLGGDAQIAELVLDGRCQRVIFFEDPHVARQHEADIQLLERAVCMAAERTTSIASPAMALRWASAANLSG